MSANKLSRATLEKWINTDRESDPVTIDDSTVDTDFDDLGVDSLTMVELADRVQEELTVPIEDDIIQSLRTPRMFMDHVNGLIGNPTRA